MSEANQENGGVGTGTEGDRFLHEQSQAVPSEWTRSESDYSSIFLHLGEARAARGGAPRV